MFKRRLGPAKEEASCSGGAYCPDILELTSGDFAVIGLDITNDAASSLPPGSGCGSGERIVRIPRQTLIEARSDIPGRL